MIQFQYNILEISKDGDFAFFECSNGDYGVIEPQDCELAVGDVLRPFESRMLPRCGVQTLILNGVRKVKVYVDDLNFRNEAYELFRKYARG